MNEDSDAVASRPDPATAWRSLCEQLGALGDEAAAIDPAVGVRHLARLVALALEEQLEHADARHPSFVRYEAPWSQWGAPNPDNVYVRTAIDPSATYRVRANVAGVRQILVSLVEGDMQLDEYGVYAERALHELDVAPDGTLELFVSPEQHAGNWLRSVPSSRLLMVRQYQYDWEHDPIATFEIERLDTRGEPVPTPAPLTIAAAIDRSAHWVERSLHYWASHSLRDGGAAPNTISAPATPPGGAPHIAYAAGQWSLAADEALLVTTDVPDADYWNWVAHSRHWFDSGDFASRQTSLNQAQVHVDGDGRVRLVVAGFDPGVPNWIDTSGQPAGMLAYRLIGVRSKPAPSAQIVPLAEVHARLPDDHPIIDAATRRDLLARRRAAVHTDEVLGRWAAVMLNADVYAEVIDRHVELASDIGWLISLLDNSDPPEDHRRRRRANNSPAVQIEGQIVGEELANRIVVITQLAEELDRTTLELALRIVPVEWWEARLGATVR